MDLEVIQTPEGMRVLEIDARFPSQTPTAVWLSTGINLAEHLAACFFPYAPGSGLGAPRFARYEHVLCKDGGLHFLGEHIMGQFGPLEPVNGFCGADEALVGGKPACGFVGRNPDVRGTGRGRRGITPQRLHRASARIGGEADWKNDF